MSTPPTTKQPSPSQLVVVGGNRSGRTFAAMNALARDLQDERIKSAALQITADKLATALKRLLNINESRYNKLSAVPANLDEEEGYFCIDYEEGVTALAEYERSRKP